MSADNKQIPLGFSQLVVWHTNHDEIIRDLSRKAARCEDDAERLKIRDMIATRKKYIRDCIMEGREIEH